MKIRSIIFALIIVLFNSCLVKSLHPFYTKEVISFDASLIGNWQSKGNNKWIIEDLKDKVLRENKVSSIEELEKADQKMYENYKGSYFVSIKDDGEESFFLVMPFTIEGQLFLDFSPVLVDSDLNSLTQNHLLSAHSLVKLDVLEEGKVRLKWFDEKRIKELFEQNKIKIKHEKLRGFLFEEEILLTAKSKELQKFIKKYMASKNEDKWKTDTKYTLTRDLTKP
jgi:hypothetical protein